MNINKIKGIFTNNSFAELFQISLYSMLSRIIVATLNLIILFIVAKYYGPEILGLMSILNTILSLCIMFALMGFNVLILKVIPEYIEQYSLKIVQFIYKKFSNLVVLFSFIIIVIIYFSIDYISSIFFNGRDWSIFLLYALPLIFFNSMSSLKLELLRALQHIKLYIFLQLISPSLSLILLFVLTLLFYYEYNPIYVIYVSGFISFIILGLIIDRKIKEYGHLEISLFKNSYLLSMSFPMFFTSLMHLVIGQTDLIMIGYFMDIAEVGVYNVALKLAMLMNFILISINAFIAPKLSQLYFSKQMEELKKLAQYSSKLMFYFSLPLMFIYIFLGTYIIEIFGNEYREAYIVLMFLIFGQFINIISGSVGLFLDMTGNQKIFQKIIFGSAIVNIVLNFVLIPYYGIYGAAFASMLSIILWNVLAIIKIKKIYGYFIGYLPFKLTKGVDI